jgi:putative ABC transport system permease protein
MSDSPNPGAPRPDWSADIRARLASLEGGTPRLDDIVDELSQHLDDRYDELCDDGMAAAAARRTALDELAGPQVLARALRPVTTAPPPSVPVLGAPRGDGWLSGVGHDVRDGLRSLRRSPVSTAVALMTLAVGIGASVAIFSIVNAVLLRPLPFAAPDRLVSFWGTDPKRGLDRVSYADALYAYFQARSRDVSGIAAYGETRVTVTNGTGEPERLAGTSVTPNFFATLGRAPLIGRTFRAEDAGTGRPRVAVIGHGLWQRRYGSDPAIAGKTLRTPDGPLTIVGVMPLGVDFPKRTELWLPLATDPQSTGCWCYATIGRLAPGRTAADAAREIAWLSDGYWREQQGKPARDPKATAPDAVVVAVPLAETLTGEVRRPLLVLLAAVGMVLLIACANIANLLLARAGARSGELAVRACLGASAGRIARQLFVENALLAAGGTLLGVGGAAWATRLLGRFASERLTHVREVPLDLRVLAFAVGAAVVTVLLFGVAPAIRGARASSQTASRDGRRTTRSTAARRLADAFVVGQFALSLVLLVGAALLLRSLGNLLAVDPGFRGDRVLVGRLTLPWPDRPPEVNLREGRAFYAALSERLTGLPGIERFGFVSSAPFSDGDFGMSFEVEGRPATPTDPALVANVRAATPGYFAAIGQPLTRGRDFTRDDRSDAPPVAIVDETLARRYWPDGGAIGRRLRLGNDGRWLTIVGVAGSIRKGDLGAGVERFVYVPQVQVPFLEMDLVVRTPLDPGAMAGAIREAVYRLDPTLPFYDVHTLDDAIAASVGVRRLTNRLLSAFALAALVLAAVGIYGVMALNVAQRVQEFGVRVALGASRLAVVGLVLRRGLALVLAGAVVGLAATAWLTRYLDALLVGVAPFDPLVLGGVTLGLITVALGACALPARRATRADPLRALRSS